MSQPSFVRRAALVVVLLAFLLAPGAAFGGPPDIIIAPAGPGVEGVASAAGDSRASDPVPAGEIRQESSATLDHVPGGAALLPDAVEAGKVEAAAADAAEVAPEATGAWTTLMTENFEGIFPAAGWYVGDNNGVGPDNPNSYWDDDDCTAYTGAWSAWPANGGSDALDPCESDYPNNAQAWMVYGPFDLSRATDAELRFYYRNVSEPGYDYFRWYASADGFHFFGTSVSGNSLGWTFVNLDLTAVPSLGNLTGDESVWIAFTFSSDGDTTAEGPFVDDIELAYVPGPNLRPFVPSGWELPVVPSPVTGTRTVGRLIAGLPTYVDLSVVNDGDGATGSTFDVCLYLDGHVLRCWVYPPLSADYQAFIDDWPLSVAPTPGPHVLRLVADPANVIAEWNEADNAWEQTFVWWSRVFVPVVIR